MLKPFDLQALSIFLCIKVALVTDGACGSGGMFVQSMRFVDAHGGNRLGVSIYGQELTDTTRRLAKMIDYEEKAFYDILVAVAEKFQFDYPDDKNIELAKEIRAALRDKEKYSDWANSMQIKALMQADIIMILAKHGYPPVPPEIYEKVYNDILEQAENFKKYSDD